MDDRYLVGDMFGPGAGTVARATVSEGYVHFVYGVTLFAHGVIYFQ